MKTCESCVHCQPQEAAYYCDVVKRLLPWTRWDVTLAEVCKHYAEPEPSEFEKWNSKQGDCPSCGHREQGQGYCCSCRHAGWRAGIEALRKENVI